MHLEENDLGKEVTTMLRLSKKEAVAGNGKKHLVITINIKEAGQNQETDTIVEDVFRLARKLTGTPG